MMKRKALYSDANDTCNMTVGDCSGRTVVLVDVSGSDLSSSSSYDDATVGDNNDHGAKDYFYNFFQQHCHDNTNVNMTAVESIDVSRCRLGPNGVSNLLSFLSNPSPMMMPMLKQICLQRNSIGSAGGRAVGNFLSFNNVVEGLDISLNDIKAGGGEPTAAKVISDALKINNSSLKVLIMDKCALGPEGATHLANSLAVNKSLTKLELAGNMIGPVGGNNLFCALEKNSTLEQLGLKMNRIGGCGDKADVRSLSNALAGGHCRIAKLDLSYNDLRCSGCTILSEALMGHHQCTLKELILEKNDISEEGCVALSNALANNERLQKLVLKGNNIGDRGAIAIGTMVKHNTSLTMIDLSSCSIGNEGGIALGHGLAENSTLQHLQLDKNALGSGSDPSFFSSGILTNKALKSLHLSDNGLGTNNGDVEIWGKSISESLSNNSSLQYVDLSSNALSESSIVDAIASHPSIEFLFMNN